MSYTRKILKTGLPEKVEIQLVRGESPDGTPTYTYLAITPEMAREMKISLMLKTTDLEEYGTILATGEGEPDEETRQYIAELIGA